MSTPYRAPLGAGEANAGTNRVSEAAVGYGQ
jgi:hypothetical protein